MSRLYVAINDVGWSVVGVALTLTYQITSNWWRKRHNKKPAPNISAAMYFGTMLLIFAIASSLFSLSSKLRQDRINSCQTQINKNNVAVANKRNDLQTTLNGDFISFIGAKAKFDAVFQGLVTHPVGNDPVKRKEARQALLVSLHDVRQAETIAHTDYNASKEFIKNHPVVSIDTCEPVN